MSNSIAIFFDLGDTLVIPRFGVDGSVSALQPLPFVTEVLDRVRSSGSAEAPHRLGVLSNTPADATTASMNGLLAEAGLLSRFEPDLLLYSSVEGHTKSEKAFFKLAASRAGVPAARCVFVGEDAKERDIASSAGFRVSFHPLHLFHVLDQIP